MQIVFKQGAKGPVDIMVHTIVGVYLLRNWQAYIGMRKQVF